MVEVSFSESSNSFILQKRLSNDRRVFITDVTGVFIMLVDLIWASSDWRLLDSVPLLHPERSLYLLLKIYINICFITSPVTEIVNLSLMTSHVRSTEAADERSQSSGGVYCTAAAAAGLNLCAVNVSTTVCCTFLHCTDRLLLHGFGPERLCPALLVDINSVWGPSADLGLHWLEGYLDSTEVPAPPTYNTHVCINTDE